LIESIGRLLREFGVASVLALGGMAILGWSFLALMRPYVQEMPRLRAELTQLIVLMREMVGATQGLRKDVQEALRELRAFQEGRRFGSRWPGASSGGEDG